MSGPTGEGAVPGAPADAGKDGTGPPRDALEDWAEALFVREDPLLAELRQEMEARDLPMIQVPARTGLLLHLLVRATGARRILEVGTLAGYSALWMARGMPHDGRLLTVEKSPEHAELARRWIERGGLAEQIEVRVGDARKILPGLDSDGGWDLCFLDADKASYLAYLREAARLLRPGGVLVADNAFWKGRVLGDPSDDDEATRGIRAFDRALAESDDFRGAILPVGDGVAFAVRA